MVEQKGSADTDRASHQRRQNLREESGGVPHVSNFFPIERYYEASDKVFQSFSDSFENRELDNAYVYGRRYCSFCMDGIYKHDYFKTKKFDVRRDQSKKRVVDVLAKLELVSEWMDVEEEEREKKRQALIQRQNEERLKKQQELELKQINDLEKRIQQQKKSSSCVSSVNLEESALAKLKAAKEAKETKDVVEDLQLEVQDAKDAFVAIVFEHNFNETTLNGVIPNSEPSKDIQSVLVKVPITS